MIYWQLIKCLIVSLLITSCVVIAPTITIPLIENKNEARIEGGISIYPGATGAITYAPINRIAFQIDGSYFPSTYYYHGAIGYFCKIKKKLIFENYFGLGRGYSEGSDNSLNPIKIKYNLYFTQFNLGLHISPKIMCGFGLKTGLMNSRLYYYSTYTNRDQSVLIEPQGFVRFGEGRFKIDLKLSGCWVSKLIMKFDNYNDQLPYEQIYSGFSVSYTIK